jgi:hypothetical protein
MASDTYNELCLKFDRTDAAVNAIKRYLGETTLGCNPAVSMTFTGLNEDAWSTFFVLIVKFAEMYKKAIVELDEWTKAEERIKLREMESAKRKETNKGRLERAALAASALEQTMANTESITQKPVSMKGGRHRSNSRDSKDSGPPPDVMQVFKDQMMYIRKRNAFKDIDDSSSDDDNGDGGMW